jgi:SAM-dependent methyltransferase
VVGLRPGASVLDVGCGPGHVAAAVLAAGAGTYVGIDLSPRMLDLARDRLVGDAMLLEGDFLELDVPGSFDVVLALGLFDYLADPARAAAWLRARCASTLVASFTRRDRVKAPVRRLHYGRHGLSVFDYTEARAGELLSESGFTDIDVVSSGRRGFLVTAGVR